MRKLFVSVLMALAVAAVAVAGAPAEKIRDILKLRLAPEAVVDSALYVIMDECIGDLDGFIEGENAFRELIVPYMNRHRDDLSLFKQSEVYSQYAMVCGQQGRERFADTQALNAKSLDLARRAEDFYMVGFVLERMATFEEMYGSTQKAFDYASEAIINYKKAPENVNREVTGCYMQLANIYLRMDDLEGIDRIIGEFSAHIAATDAKDRDYMLYQLYRLMGVKFSNLLEDAAQARRAALRDSVEKYSSAAVRLYETSDNKMLRRVVNPVWLYYNRASEFIDLYDKPQVDSVEHYLALMTSSPLYVREDAKVEIEVSRQQLRADMWLKAGDYAKAETLLLELLGEIAAANAPKDIIHNRLDIYKSLRRIAEQTGRYEQALVYADSLSLIERQQLDNEHRDAIKDSEVRYRTQETELALARSEARRANTLAWLFGAAGLLLAAVTIFIVYAGRQRRRRMQKYVEGLENERRRMSRELHDGVCNDLLAIRMNLGADAGQTARMLDTCRESVRRISHELMPPEFAYANLDEATRFFIAKQAEANAGRIAFTYESAADGAAWADVPDSVALEVYRIVQEATGNAVRHSGATAIGVSLRLSATLLSAEIADNGTFKSSARKGLGLESMRRRAGSVGGRIETRTTENGGTAVRLNVKL